MADHFVSTPSTQIAIVALGNFPGDFTHGAYRLYEVSFNEHKIETVVTSSFLCVTHWIRETYNLHPDYKNLVVGVKICPVGHEDVREEAIRRKRQVNTIALCVGHRCLIFEIRSDADFIPVSLSDFLLNTRHQFFGCDMQMSVSRLRSCHLDMLNYVDLLNHVDLFEYALQNQKLEYPTMNYRVLVELLMEKCYVSVPIDEPKTQIVRDVAAEAFLNCHMAHALNLISWLL